MDIILVPFHDWKKSVREGFRTRDGHWMQLFGQHPSVDKLLIINRPVSLAEMIATRRSWRTKDGQVLMKGADFCLSKVAEKTYCLDFLIPEILRPVIKQRAWIPYIWGKNRIAEQIKSACRFLSIDKQWILFSPSPLVAPLVSNLRPPVFTFDAQDNLLKISLYRSIPGLAEYYEFCRTNADIVMANSPEMTQWLLEKRNDAFLVANGVSPQFFDPSHPYVQPPDLQNIPRPIIGYAGKLQEQLDVELMKYLATQLKEVHFVFIGQNLNPSWGKELWTYPNIHHLGDKHYLNLPAYLHSFDICIIPYHESRQHGNDPIKFYEYISMNKPVVSINIGTTNQFQDYPQVCIARSHEEFLSGIVKFLEMIQKNQQIPIKNLPQECFWEYKAEQILEKIAKKI